MAPAALQLAPSFSRVLAQEKAAPYQSVSLMGDLGVISSSNY
jgi:hypothetical protein